MRTVRSLILLLCVLALAGCATSHMLTGTPRAPIDPAQVRIYTAHRRAGMKRSPSCRPAAAR